MKGRTEDFVRFVGGAAGQSPRIIVSRLQPALEPMGNTSLAISTVDDPGPGAEATPPRFLLDRVSAMGIGCRSTECDVPTDSLGRLYLTRATFMPSTRQPGGTEQRDEVFRVDPRTGATDSFGRVSDLQLSADRTRTAVLETGDELALRWIVRELGGEETIVPWHSDDLFVDNDFYFRTDDAQIRRLRPDRQSEVVATDVGNFQVKQTERGPLLVIRLFRNPAWVLVDPVTLAVSTLPLATASSQQIFPSPSGRYLFSLGGSDQTSRPPVTFFDRDTGEEQQDISPVPFGRATPVWRPGHDEIWLQTGDDIWAWKPGERLMKLLEGGLSTPFFNSGPDQSLFTRDGRFWFWALPGVSGQGETFSIFLRSADDPGYEPLLLNPSGAGVAGLWPLPDGRLLVELYISDAKRNDIYIVDPVARTTRALANTGNVLAVGRDRFLALLHWVTGGSGELTIVDVATGAHQRLGENVYSVAVEKQASDDPLAPETRVAFLVRNRIASPFDGLWVTALP